MSTARRRRTGLSYTDVYLPGAFTGQSNPGPGARSQTARRHGRRLRETSPAAAVARGAIRAVDRLELLERAAGADCHARQRRFRQVRGHLRLLAQTLVESLQQRASPGE